jgi:hypothetical protein
MAAQAVNLGYNWIVGRVKLRRTCGLGMLLFYSLLGPFVCCNETKQNKMATGRRFRMGMSLNKLNIKRVFSDGLENRWFELKEIVLC